MVCQGGTLLPLLSAPATNSQLTSRKSKLLRLEDDKMLMFRTHDKSKPSGWIDKLQQAGFCLSDTTEVHESIKCFRSSLKAPSKAVIGKLCRTCPKPGVHLLNRMQDLCTFLEATEKDGTRGAAAEATVQLHLNDIHAVVMELDEGLMDSAAADGAKQDTDAADGGKAACCEWLKGVQAYVLYLQKQLAAPAPQAAEEARTQWLNLVHEMRVSFHNVVSEVRAAALLPPAGEVEEDAAPAPTPRRWRRVVRTSSRPYSYWSKRIAI